MLNVTRDGDVFLLDGEIDMSNVDELVRSVAAAVDTRTVRLDMSRVTFIDSTGIRGLIRIAKLLEGGEIVLVSPHPRVLKVLRLVRLDETPTFRIVEDAEASEPEDQGETE